MGAPAGVHRSCRAAAISTTQSYSRLEHSLGLLALATHFDPEDQLDHLESLVRSGRAHGRTRQAPPATLARVRVVDGCVCTDSETGDYIAELVGGEARWLCSATNAVPNGVVRHLATVLLDGASDARRDEVAAMTDDEFWALLLNNPDTAGYARALRRDPAAWQTVPLTEGTVDGLDYEVSRLYLDMPVVNSRPLLTTHPALAELPSTPWACRIIPPDAITEFEKDPRGSWR